MQEKVQEVLEFDRVSKRSDKRNVWKNTYHSKSFIMYIKNSLNIYFHNIALEFAVTS